MVQIVPGAMTEKQYQLLLALYHEYNEAFISLSATVQDAFYDCLYARKGFVPSPTQPK